MQLGFNSIKVRLKQTLGYDIYLFVQGFNSIKVRLKQEERPLIKLPTGCFNSIKVRLKQDEANLRNAQDQFQFHKGPIKAVATSMSSIFAICFNSIKVRLKLYIITDFKIYRRSFNSIKVRLKPFALVLSSLCLSFQFHKGPIKAMKRLPRSFHTVYVSIP